MAVTHLIDSVVNLFAKLYSWFSLIMVVLVTANVLGRFFFDIRNDFAVDTTWQLYGMLIIFGCSYAMGRDAHIRTDLLWNKFSNRTKALIDLAGYILLFFPAFAIITYISFGDTALAIHVNERSSATMSQLIIWPMKVGITAGLVLLMAQGISQSIKCYHRIIR